MVNRLYAGVFFCTIAAIGCNPKSLPPKANVAAPTSDSQRPANQTAPEGPRADADREPALGCRSERSGNVGHPSGEWFEGAHSKLCAALVEAASHDGSNGKTRLVFDGGPSLQQVQHELGGIYRVFSHSERAHAFVIGGQFETGVIVLVERLGLVDDHTGSLRWSSYHPPLHIASIVASPDGDTLALVAAPDDSENLPFRLWSYSVSTDALSRLGPAPGPPPNDWECDRAYPSRWVGTPRNEGYAAMDLGVITFPSEGALQVSYGSDTCKARAKSRSTRRWDLARAARWRQPARQPDTE